MKSQLIVCTVLILAMLASPAFAGCGKWVIRDNTDFLTDPIFDDAVASSTGSSATANADGTEKAKNGTEQRIAKKRQLPRKRPPPLTWLESGRFCWKRALQSIMREKPLI